MLHSVQRHHRLALWRAGSRALLGVLPVRFDLAEEVRHQAASDLRLRTRSRQASRTKVARVTCSPSADGRAVSASSSSTTSAGKRTEKLTGSVSRAMRGSEL